VCVSKRERERERYIYELFLRLFKNLFELYVKLGFYWTNMIQN